MNGHWYVLVSFCNGCSIFLILPDKSVGFAFDVICLFTCCSFNDAVSSTASNDRTAVALLIERGMEVGDCNLIKVLSRRVPGGMEEVLRNLGKVRLLSSRQHVCLIGGRLYVFIFVAFVVV